MKARPRSIIVFGAFFIVATFVYIGYVHFPKVARRHALEASENVYQSYLEKRRELVGGHPENVNPWNTGTHMYFWDYLLPTFSCPYTTQRIGKLGDGGKWVCGFELFERARAILHWRRPCVLYSLGVGYESTFEDEFLKRTDCEIFAYDASVDKLWSRAAWDKRVHFEKLDISGNSSSRKANELTLRQIMDKNGHSWIDFLKMDIDGSEIKAISQVLDDFEILPFGHFNLEVHGDQEGKLFPEIYKLFERMEQKGLRPFKNEMNHWPSVGMKLRPFLAEYSFINIFGDSSRLLS